MSDNTARDHHPSTPDPGDAAVARVNALRAARGLDPLPAERDPAEVRLELADARDAALCALATLRPDRGAAVPDALAAATTGQPGVVAALPVGTALAIRDRLPADYRPAIVAAVTPELERFRDGDPSWERATLAVFRIGDAVRAAIGDACLAEVRAEHPDADTEHVAQAAAVAADIVVSQLCAALRDEVELYSGMPMADTTIDVEYENRCRRASVLNMLAQIRGDDAMQTEAAQLAIMVCHDRPGMRPSDVWRHGTPLLMLPADATPAEVDAALCAELDTLGDDSTAP